MITIMITEPNRNRNRNHGRTGTGNHGRTGTSVSAGGTHSGAWRRLWMIRNLPVT
jgi:hypothetical protein